MKTATKINNIQVLRAFAAVTVAIYHTGFVFPYMHPFGSFGVDVFFVISGFIMARILDGDGGDDFLRRRILRIVPPYWFFTLLIFGAAYFAPHLMGATRASVGDLLKSLFFIPFAKANGAIEPVLFVGWSLNFEMFFYVALAIGLAVWRPQAVWVGCAIIVAVVLLSGRFEDRSVVASFYARDISLEFIFGVFAYYIWRAVPSPAAFRFAAPALAVCLASALVLIIIQGVFAPVASHAVEFGLASFLLVLSASVLSLGGWDTTASLPILVGDASYILYLVHTFCEYSIDRVLGPHIAWLSLTAPGMIISVAFSLVVAILLHIYFERPTISFLNRRYGGKRKSVEFSGPTQASPAAAVFLGRNEKGTA